MKFEIKSWYDAGVLFSLECGSLKIALEAAVKSGANLDGANLDGANLFRANLVGANLDGAKGIDPNRCIPLRILLEQQGKIRAYKLTDSNGMSPLSKTKLKYEVGISHEISDANTDLTEQCGTGLHVCTLDWAMREWRTGYRIFVVEFTATDIACIPIGTDGKFRVRRPTVVAEKNCQGLGLK